jgi:hypothetical protein
MLVFLHTHMSELTDLKIRAAIRAVTRTKQSQRLRDGRGLMLHVSEHATACWRFRYRHEGLEKMISLGIYPDVPLAAAREKLDEARKLVAAGVDPSAQRKAERAAEGNTLGALAEKYFAPRAPAISPDTLVRERLRGQLHLRPQPNHNAPPLDCNIASPPVCIQQGMRTLRGSSGRPAVVTM